MAHLLQRSHRATAKLAYCYTFSPFLQVYTLDNSSEYFLPAAQRHGLGRDGLDSYHDYD